jgi:hypothetical protein
MPSKYSDALKAQVIAEWKAGATELRLATLTGVPRTTLQKWLVGQERAAKQTEEYDLDKMAWELVGDSFTALRAILRKSQDDSWLHKQDANDLAIFFGVTSDKLLRLLAAGTKPAADRGEPVLEQSAADRSA